MHVYIFLNEPCLSFLEDTALSYGQLPSQVSPGGKPTLLGLVSASATPHLLQSSCCLKNCGINPAWLQETWHSLFSFCLLPHPGDQRFKTAGCRARRTLATSAHPRPKLGNAGSRVPAGHNSCPSKTSTPSPKQADGEGPAWEGRSKQIPLQPLATCNDFMV